MYSRYLCWLLYLPPIGQLNSFHFMFLPFYPRPTWVRNINIKKKKKFSFSIHILQCTFPILISVSHYMTILTNFKIKNKCQFCIKAIFVFQELLHSPRIYLLQALCQDSHRPICWSHTWFSSFRRSPGPAHLIYIYRSSADTSMSLIMSWFQSGVMGEGNIWSMQGSWGPRLGTWELGQTCGIALCTKPVPNHDP